MNTLAYQFRYRRHLPHIQPPGAILFLTFRLAGSIPKEAWLELRAQFEALHRDLTSEAGFQPTASAEKERRWFQSYERHLDGLQHGPTWLRDPRIAGLVAETLHHFDGDRYQLEAFCIMPNHVHVVLVPLPTTLAGRDAFLRNELTIRQGQLGYFSPTGTEEPVFQPLVFHSLASIMHSIKRHTALEANRLLARKGAFWEAESYDHFIRDENSLQRTLRYVLRNPVKAGLAKEWKDWPWNWLRQQD